MRNSESSCDCSGGKGAISAKGRNYWVHDNGQANPFRVHIARKCVTVYKVPENLYLHRDFNEWSERKVRKLYTEMVCSFPCVKTIFLGKHPEGSHEGPKSKSFSLGNSVLLHIKDLQYVFIGMFVSSFTTTEPITDFFSEIRGSDNPVPIAVSKTKVYFMIQKREVPKTVFPPRTDFAIDAYDYYTSGLIDFRDPNAHEELREHIKKMKDMSSDLHNFHMWVERPDRTVE